MLVTSINPQKPETETTYLYSLPAEDAENSDEGDDKDCAKTHNEHQGHLAFICRWLKFKYVILK